MKAMIFAAGLGTRLQPITNEMPKALVPIRGKPLIEYVIQRLKKFGVEDIIINVHHFPDLIVDFLKKRNSFDIHIEISDERNMLLDTGGGMKKAAHFFDDGKPFLIHNVDILSNVDLKQLYDFHCRQQNCLASLVVNRRETYRYLLFDHQNRLSGWVNERTGETKPSENINSHNFNKLAYAGMHVVSPVVFEIMQKQGDKFPIMDFYLENCQTQKIAGYTPKDLKMIDVGKLNALDAAEEFVSIDETTCNYSAPQFPKRGAVLH